MTRENKVGLAVCGAFLCLVGVVTALKLREPAASADSPPPAVASSAASPGDKADPLQENTPPALPAPPPPADVPSPKPPAEPPPLPGGGIMQAGGTLPPTNPDPTPAPAPPPMTPAQPPPMANPTLPPPATPPPSVPAPPAAPPADPSPPPVLPPPLAPPAAGPLPPPSVPAPPAAEDPMQHKEVVIPAASTPPTVPDLPPPPAPPGPPPMQDAPPQPPPHVNVEPMPVHNDAPAPPSINLDPAPPKPIHEINIPARSGPPLAPPPAPGASVIAATPPGAARPPNPSAPSTPLVDSWDERTYVVRKDDTFAAVSQSFYKTEDYGAALEMYNRNHPRASASLRSKGTLAEGDKIYIPEQRILEKRHADLVKPKPICAGRAPATLARSRQNSRTCRRRCRRRRLLPRSRGRPIRQGKPGFAPLAGEPPGLFPTAHGTRPASRFSSNPLAPLNDSIYL